MELFSKGDFYTHYNNGLLVIPSLGFKGYVKPVGGLCEVRELDGTTQLINGDARLINDALSQLLVNQGITGNIIVQHPKVSRGVNRWINYSLGKEDISEWINDVTVHVFDTPKEGRVKVKQIETQSLTVGNLRSTIDRLSKDPDFDGLYMPVEHKVFGERWYHMLPNRYMTGKIVSIITGTTNTIQGFICEIIYLDKIYTIKVTSAAGNLKADWWRYRHQLPGKSVKIQYTSFTPGDRLRNFSSPTIISIDDGAST